MNCENPFVDSILLLTEKEEDIPKHPKITQKVIGKRLTYQDAIQGALKFTSNAIVVLANADIYLNHTARLLWSVNLEDTCLALLR